MSRGGNTRDVGAGSRIGVPLPSGTSRFDIAANETDLSNIVMLTTMVSPATNSSPPLSSHSGGSFDVGDGAIGSPLTGQEPVLSCRTVTRDPHKSNAVVFDIGGVLLDWDPDYLFRKLIADDEERRWFLAEVCSPAWNAGLDGGRSWAEATAELGELFPQHSNLIAAYDERWEEMVAGAITGTVAVLADLRSAGVPTFALTNFSAEKWEVAKGRWDFLAGFDGAVVSGTEKVTKPDLRIYEILLGRYALDPARTFYTDDLKANVKAARVAGLDAEVFVDPDTLRQQLVDRGVLSAVV